MTPREHYATAPEDRISFAHKLIYGLGAFINNTLAAASGGMIIVLNLGLGMNPALVGLLGALPRLTDALTDPLMGYISDHTRTRWGRRRPYIFAGAIIAGISFALLWQLPREQSETFYFIYFLLGSIIFYLGYTVFATPWVALGYELTPDYHERTRLMGVQNFIGQLAYVVSPWFLWIMTYDGFFKDQVDGAAGLAVIVAVVTIGIGILPAILLRERFREIAKSEGTSEASRSAVRAFKNNLLDFFKGFGQTIKSGPFLKLCVATFMVFNGFMLVSSFQFYVIIYYVFQGNQQLGAEYAGYAGTLGAISTFGVIVLITWLGTRVGKRQAFFWATGISIVGYGLKWFCYNPAYPWLVLLPAPLLAFGLGGLFTLMGSMVADVVDVDELTTYERREGMFGSIFWWVVKLGMAAALAGGGFLLNATGFDVDSGGMQSERTIFLMRLFDAGIPMVTSAIAIWAIARFPITEESAHEVRVELERRRGSAEAKAPELKNIAYQHAETMHRIIEEQNIEQNVDALLARMSLDQKIGQMTQTERLAISPEEVKAYHLGSVLSGGGSVPGENTPADWVAMNDAYWVASMEEDDAHLAIPILYGVDAIHGHNNVRGATVFPHNIGLGATGDPELLERIAQVTASEVRATGVEWTFAPTLAVARNDRWGRTYESYSEDPDTVRVHGERFVRGLQGDLGTSNVVACAKHWVGDGGTTDGIDQGDTAVSLAELQSTHIAPYYGALQAGVLTVMASYNSWNGNKCHGHEYLLSDVLKSDLGFRGFVISDWNGIDQLSDDFHEAVALSVNAGIDMFMVPEKWKEFIATLRDLVERGTVSMDRIDDAVRRILTVKFIAGLFDQPRPAEREFSNHSSFGSSEHRDVAREAVRKSMVLLKNDADILPLQSGGRILVAGKSADNRGHQCGGFTVAWQGVSSNEEIEGGTSIWEGLQQKLPDAVLSVDGSAAESGPFDAAVVVIGELPYAEGLGDVRAEGVVSQGSSMSRPGLELKPYGSSLELSITHPEDLETIRRIRAQGIPVIAVLLSGRPLVVNNELEESQAFVAAWLPGSEGAGVADILCGEYDFSGTLSFSWPRSDQDNWNRGDEQYNPLFPFGYGMTYNNA